jgi:putative DNA methylase
LEEDSRLTALFLWTLQATETEANDPQSQLLEDEDDEGTQADDDEETPKKRKAGLSLIYDVARRFAQPLGIHLDKWEGRVIETEKGIVRLLPVAERAKQLFGDADASAMAHRIEQDVKASRNYTFAFMKEVVAPPEIMSRGRGKAKPASASGAAAMEAPTPQTVTTLDRVHAAMLLQASGQANGLRVMLKEEQQRGPDFLRLANALSALYPKESEEKRLLDAMLLAVPRS